jgi:serine/threonine-protein kinase
VRTGNVLHGKYRLEREIGRGAMGTVWSAIHLTLDQRVAIKIISSDYANSAEAISRFHTEAKAAAKLRSRHVVQVYDDGETPEGLPYIVMEYLDGESLEDRIQRERDLPLAEAVRITAHVGRALSRAHARGIVHRDLKPANIFVTKTDDDEMGWVAKVLDFGIAKLDDNRDKSTTKTGTVLGTPLFMSAEQVRGASTVDARADLYSLGMVFYNMVTGKYAYEGTSFGDLLVSICTDQLPRLADSAPWASRALEEWFQKACAREPANRFQSADEMVDELHAAANLSFDGRMSFSDEHSSVSKVAVVPRERGLRAGDTGNERQGTYGVAQTHPASELATNTGDASVHTIPGVPVKKRWVLPAVLGSVALVALIGVGWYFASKATLPETASTKEVGATAEVLQGTRPQAVPAEPVPKATADQVAAPTQPDSEGTPPDAEAVADSAAKAKDASASKASAATATPGKLTGPGSKSGSRPIASSTSAKSTSKSTRTKTRKASGDVDIGF